MSQVDQSPTFEADALFAALLQPDDGYAVEVDEPEFQNWKRRVTDAFDRGSFEDPRAPVIDDSQSIDHRSLSLGPGPLTRRRPRSSRLSDTSSGHHVHGPRVGHRDLMDALGRVRTRDVGETHVVSVTRFIDERVRSIETVRTTQLDRALAPSREFTSD